MIKNNTELYSIDVKFSLSNGNSIIDEFFADGRFRTQHTKPSLTLIKRPVKKLPLNIENLTKILYDHGEIRAESADDVLSRFEDSDK